MRLKSFHVRNFRRLNDVHVDLEETTTIFVGSNNSGKTSATQVFKHFLDKKESFSIHDFSAFCWSLFDEIGASPSANSKRLPVIELDLWFTVESDDLHRVLPLLPSLDWKDSPVGIRMVYAPKDQETLLSNFREANSAAATAAKSSEGDPQGYHPWPKKLTDYLSKRLKEEYRIYYYVLDRAQFDDNFQSKQDYTPQLLGEAAEAGRKVVESLIKVDFLFAQRYLSDASSKGRSENLSTRMSRFYERNLEKLEDDFTAVKALANSEAELNKHLEKVFAPTLKQLNNLGYPGLTNPQLVIRSAFDPESVLSKSASIHYVLPHPDISNATSADPPSLPVAAQQYLTLPDNYNGLGFKNLIYMVIELLDFHSRWADQEESRAPVHLVFVEEPEAHLHVQLQQVFIAKVNELITDEGPLYRSQLVVTTHSPHIIYESSFTPIRYFQRANMLEHSHYSTVLNLSNFKEDEPDTTNFLRQYMKLTHCDLFFADAAVLVEGNVERLLLPLMIEKAAPQLKSNYLSILELGGAFAHKFQNLIQFLGLTALVITDLDSVALPEPKAAGARQEANIDEDSEEEESEPNNRAKACPTFRSDAVSSNQTLIQWIPGLKSIAALLAAPDTKKLVIHAGSPGMVRVAYQTKQELCWKTEKASYAGRTFEEMFALENLEWCQNEQQKALKLRLKSVTKLTLADIAQKLFDKVNSSSFGKTDFALALMMASPDWVVPKYIEEGLCWLRDQLTPEHVEPVTKEIDASPEAASTVPLDGSSLPPGSPLHNVEASQQ